MPTGETDQKLTPTSATEWGKAQAAPEEGFITPLPSGNVVRMKRSMDMMALLATGKIPNPLAKIVSTMIDQGNPNFPTEQMDPAALRQLMNLLNDTACKVVLEPKFSQPIPQGKVPGKPKETWDEYVERVAEWVPDTGTISIFDVETEDKMFIMAVAQGGAADLTKFRDEQNAIMAGVQTGEGVGEPPKPNRRTRRAS